MRTKDWKTINNAKVLVVGKGSNLQWPEAVSEYVIFADYYFRGFPEGHSERSRNVETRGLSNYIIKLTGNQMIPEDFYIANLHSDNSEPAPKGERVLIPEDKALKGIEHIEWILSQNPIIEYVLAMSLQTNHWLQKSGSYKGSAELLSAAEPRHIETENYQSFYQSVDGKVFIQVCGGCYDARNSPVKVIPTLPAKDFPLSEQNIERYGETCKKVSNYFKQSHQTFKRRNREAVKSIYYD